MRHTQRIVRHSFCFISQFCNKNLYLVIRVNNTKKYMYRIDLYCNVFSP
jgi:hypothetical protein